MTKGVAVAEVPAGYRYVFHPSLDSTMDEALRLAADGETGPLWIRAGEQTRGKGRRGRPWVSVPGNLYVALLVEIDNTAAKLTELGFVTGIALHSTVAEAFGGDHGAVALKWPNDLLINDAKASGMLLECGGVAPSGRWPLAIGVGLNLVSHPTDTAYATTHLAEHGCDTNADEIFAIFAREFAAWYDLWDNGYGFARIRQAWCERAGGFGRPVTVNLGDSTIAGEFAGIAENGALVLRKADGSKTEILAGDVFLQSSRGNTDAQEANKSAG